MPRNGAMRQPRPAAGEIIDSGVEESSCRLAGALREEQWARPVRRARDKFPFQRSTALNIGA